MDLVPSKKSSVSYRMRKIEMFQLLWNETVQNTIKLWNNKENCSTCFILTSVYSRKFSEFNATVGCLHSMCRFKFEVLVLYDNLAAHKLHLAKTSSSSQKKFHRKLIFRLLAQDIINNSRYNKWIQRKQRINGENCSSRKYQNVHDVNLWLWAAAR